MKNNNAFPRIYLSAPHMSEEGYEQEYVQDAFKSNWIAPLGPHVDAFEREFASYIGAKHAAALSSGTAALHLAMLILGMQKDDEVVCSTFTFSATANAITYLAARPIFIDSDQRTWNLDPNLLEDFFKKRSQSGKLPKAVIAVDLYGQASDYDPIVETCERFGVTLIEDAAEALSASYKGKKTGRFGRVAAFSFNGNKIITTSGGGMLVSDEEWIIDKCRFFATQSRDQAPHYQHSEIGYNYRLSNILAAIGRGQLKVLDQRRERKRDIFEYYRVNLGGLPGIEFMPEPEGFYSSRWLTCMAIDPDIFGASREDIRLALEAENIESRPLWKPMHMQPVFAKCEKIGGTVSEDLFENGLCLPSGTIMEEEQLSLICDVVKSKCRT